MKQILRILGIRFAWVTEVAEVGMGNTGPCPDYWIHCVKKKKFKNLNRVTYDIRTWYEPYFSVFITIRNDGHIYIEYHMDFLPKTGNLQESTQDTQKHVI